MAKSPKSSSTPIKASDTVRAEIESCLYRRPSEIVVRKKGHGADGRENLEVDETIVYSLLRYSTRISLPIGLCAYGKLNPISITSWTGEPVVYDGRQRRKAADEINDRLAMIDNERNKLGEDGKDLAVLRNHCLQKAQLAPKSWHWATEESLPLYIGGRVGDAKQGFDAPGYLLPDGYVQYVLWSVYQDIDPDSIEMMELSSAAEHARKSTPPSKLATRIQTMLTELPKAHVAKIMGCTERSLQDKLLVLKVTPEVQAAVDLGGERGGISWTQMRDSMFRAGKGGELVPIDPAEQINKLPEIAGTKKRGGGNKSTKTPEATLTGNVSQTTESTPKPAESPTKPAEDQAPKVIKLRPEVLIGFAKSLEDGAESLDMDNPNSPDAKDDMCAMAAVLRFVAGDSEILDEFPVAKDCLMAALKKMGGTLVNPVAEPAQKEISEEVKIATKVLDLCESWCKTRKPEGDEFSPNWPQGENLSKAVVKALDESQQEYRAHQKEARANGDEPTEPEIWIEEWVNENLMKVRAAA